MSATWSRIYGRNGSPGRSLTAHRPGTDKGTSCALPSRSDRARTGWGRLPAETTKAASASTPTVGASDLWRRAHTPRLMAALVHPCGDQRRQRAHRPFVVIVSHRYDLRVSHSYASGALTSRHTRNLSYNGQIWHPAIGVPPRRSPSYVSPPSTSASRQFT
jgi:hypothetical protein